MLKKQFVLLLSFMLFFVALTLPEMTEAKSIKRVSHSKPVQKNKKITSYKKFNHKAKIAKGIKKTPRRGIASISTTKALKKNAKTYRKGNPAKVKRHKRNLPKEYGTI